MLRSKSLKAVKKFNPKVFGKNCKFKLDFFYIKQVKLPKNYAGIKILALKLTIHISPFII